MKSEVTEQLYQQCRQGKMSAQKKLYTLFAKKMFLVCYRYVKNKEDAEDILAEGFVKVFKHLKTMDYQGSPAFNGWIRKIIVNESLQFLRRRKQIIFEDTNSDTDYSDIEMTFSNLYVEDLYKLITALPTGLRTVFNLSVIEGYNHGEIAALLDITESASRAQLSKARKILQQQIVQTNVRHL